MNILLPACPLRFYLWKSLHAQLTRSSRQVNGRLLGERVEDGMGDMGWGGGRGLSSCPGSVARSQITFVCPLKKLLGQIGE